MAWLKSYKIVRENADTLFFDTPDNVKKYIKETYEDTGKKTTVVTDNKKNTTLWTVITEFADSTAKSEWDNDSAVKTMLAERRSYNIANNITVERSVENV